MSFDTDESTNGIDAAIRAGMDAALAENRIVDLGELAGDGIPLAVTPKGTQVQVLREAIELAERRAPAPRRRTGRAELAELESFIAHVNRFKSEGSVIFADLSALALEAVYNYHPGGPDATSAAWCDHRARYACPRSREWKAWCERDERAMPQEEFGDFLEERLEDLTSQGEKDEFPTPIAVLEMARSLRVYTKGRFEKVMNPTTGEYSMVVKEEHDSASTKIYRAFLLAVPVFEGGDLYRVEVRVRFALREGRPLFSYRIHQRAQIEADAFKDARAAAAQMTDLPILAGSPER